ncbi:FAD-dependent oxidoreductase [Streptomyces sp. NPDC093089]|uniref:FAD-dependent oxidoreductase n=1 Tax=Streptomyces sp. NPDC093089 TaxID=3366024 RepID=UPI00382F040D
MTATAPGSKGRSRHQSGRGLPRDRHRRRRRGRRLDRRASEAARRVGRDHPSRARPLRVVCQLRPAVPHRRSHPRAGQPAAADPESLARSLALDVRTAHEVLSIDRQAKEVEVRDLDADRVYRESYDTLVLCPGAGAIRPPIPGESDPRVDVQRGIADMDRIIAHLEKGAARAVVVGGSCIGLELAEALRSRGLETTVVERTDRLMQWLDHEMTRILHHHVNSHDVDVRLSTSADAIAGHDSAYRATQGTAVVKVLAMTADGTGLTEAQLHTAGIPYRKVYAHPSGHAAYYPGTAPLFMKVLLDPAEGKLLGARVLGRDGVDKRIDVLAVAQRAGMTVYDLEHLELAYAPPYGSAKDPVDRVGFLAANLLRGDIRLWYPECADRALILDTRTPAE